MLHGFTFTEDEFGPDELRGRADMGDVGDCGALGDLGDLGGSGGMGAFLGDSYDVSICGGVRLDDSNVRIEASSSSSSISYNVVRSE